MSVPNRKGNARPAIVELRAVPPFKHVVSRSGFAARRTEVEP